MKAFLLLLFLLPLTATGAPLRICSQNLNRLGEERAQPGWTRVTQQDYLAGRIREARCDLIAVQEVFGRTREEAQRHLDRLARVLHTATGRTFTALVGESANDPIRNGFLIADTAGRLLETRSLFGAALPKLSAFGGARSFTRGPFAVLLDPPQAGGRKIFAVSLHFKSRQGGWKDRQGLDYEALRVEQAEALREWVEREAPAGAVVLLLGDRNGEAGSAAAEVLRGARRLADFRRGCQIDSKLQPLCPQLPAHPPLFAELFRLRAERNPRLAGEGSLRFRGRQILIDEILVRPADLPRFLRPDGTPHTGFSGQFGRGSDHKLLWTELSGGTSAAP